ncbi:pilus assembly protein TadG-related protein [Caulobacter sp. KR2-114]|uniref:pilus assembly protein TadG-related protein n=1 Tax=Caulobacter sp. KR2-114 TaxID=3400912 RepID=UPI003C0D2DBB
MALIAAAVTPVLALLTCGAVDLSSLSFDHATMQDVADATALAAAKQLGMGDAQGTSARAQQYAASMMADVAKRITYQVSAVPSSDGTEITVAIDGYRDSFFGNLLPPGGWKIHVQATAQTLGRVPLCVLAHGDKTKSDQSQGVVGQNLGGMHLQDSSQIAAPGCMAHSNFDINVDNNALLQAGLVQASGVAKGAISPAPQSGAPEIEDPFKDIDVSVPSGGCSAQAGPAVKYTGASVLPAGVHCGGLQITGDAVLTLAPGEHYFVGDVTIDQNAQVTGDDVVLIFDRNSRFDFKGNSSVSLKGRREGALAGFVAVTTRTNGHVFHISAPHVDQLLGTIYVPNATLQVEGASRVGQASQWTVIVARQLQLNGGPTLVINANYAGSSVPVPGGVGPNSPVQVGLKK